MQLSLTDSVRVGMFTSLFLIIRMVTYSFLDWRPTAVMWPPVCDALYASCRAHYINDICALQRGLLLSVIWSRSPINYNSKTTSFSFFSAAPTVSRETIICTGSGTTFI
jgi:hypothetical protein